MSVALQADSLPTELPGKPRIDLQEYLNIILSASSKSQSWWHILKWVAKYYDKNPLKCLLLIKYNFFCVFTGQLYLYLHKSSINYIFTIILLFSHSVVSDFLWPHRLQHASLPCPSPSPGAYWNSCPLSRWCHPTILSSIVPFSFCLQSFPASGSFLISCFFTSNGQSIRASASASVLPMNIQYWFSLGLTGLISLQSKELSRVFSNTTVQKHQFFDTQPSLWSNSHIHTWLLEKP